MKQAYRFAIFYFSLFAVLLLASAGAIQAVKIGMTPESVRLYYQGDPAVYMPAKSSQGLLKSAMPHLASVGLFVMVSAHFFLFAPKRVKRHAVRIAVVLFTVSGFNIGAPFFIAAGMSWAVYVKIAAFWLMSGLGLWLLGLLCLTSWRGIVKNHS